MTWHLHHIEACPCFGCVCLCASDFSFLEWLACSLHSPKLLCSISSVSSSVFPVILTDPFLSLYLCLSLFDLFIAFSYPPPPSLHPLPCDSFFSLTFLCLLPFRLSSHIFPLTVKLKFFLIPSHLRVFPNFLHPTISCSSFLSHLYCLLISSPSTFNRFHFLLLRSQRVREAKMCLFLLSKNKMISSVWKVTRPDSFKMLYIQIVDITAFNIWPLLRKKQTLLSLSIFITVGSDLLHTG